MHLPSLEIHVPISANPRFFNMTHCLVRSLRMFGGPYANAKVVLTIGEPEIDPGVMDKVPFLKELNVDVRWLSPEKFAQHSFYGTAVERFLYPFESDMVMMLDADTMVVSPFTDLVVRMHEESAFAGYIAHICPFPEFDYWQRIYDHCGLGEVKAEYEHTGWGYMFSDESRRYTPPYFNLGSLCAPASIMTRIGAIMYEMMQKVDDIEETFYRCQIALSLAVTKLGIRHHAMAARYNFPNRMMFEAMYPRELENASIIHLLDEHQGVSKNTLFASRENIEEFLNRTDLRGVNLKIQAALAAMKDDMMRSGLLTAVPSPITSPAPPPAAPAWKRVAGRVKRAVHNQVTGRH